MFAAGVAMRHLEFVTSGDKHPGEVIGAVSVGEEPVVASHPEKAPAYMTESVLGFNQKLEKIAEFIMVLLVGILLSRSGFSAEGALLAALLFFLIRPLTVFAALPWSQTTMLQRRLIGWFGIRGIGSLYYLVFALQFHPWMEERYTSLVLTVIAISVMLHGLSATPLMALYRRRRQ